jgi:hypothetical protein
MTGELTALDNLEANIFAVVTRESGIWKADDEMKRCWKEKGDGLQKINVQSGIKWRGRISLASLFFSKPMERPRGPRAARDISLHK